MRIKLNPMKRQLVDSLVQILYVPNHVLEKLDNEVYAPDILFEKGVERGFIVSDGISGAYCKYFYPDDIAGGALRTVSTTELTPWGNLFRMNHHQDSEISEIYYGLGRNRR